MSTFVKNEKQIASPNYRSSATYLYAFEFDWCMPRTTERLDMQMKWKIACEPFAQVEVHEKPYPTSYLLAFSLAITATIASSVFVP